MGRGPDLYLRVRSQRRPKLGRGVEVGWRGYTYSEDEIGMAKMTRSKCIPSLIINTNYFAFPKHKV
jgi:hypothetical protein